MYCWGFFILSFTLLAQKYASTPALFLSSSGLDSSPSTFSFSCLKETFESLGADAHRQCFCDGWTKLQSMAAHVARSECDKNQQSQQGGTKYTCLPAKEGPRRTLLVIDMQNDFIFGSLPVPGAQDIINKVEDLTKLDIWHQVIYSQDWHPTDHVSFFSNLGLRQLGIDWVARNNRKVEDINMFEEVEFERNPPYKQVLWPDHCIQGSEGAKFHPSLTQPKKSQVIQKGTNPQIDAYSAFFDNTDIKDSGDTGLKDLVRDSTEIVVVGLAQDYCVAWTALDSLQVLGLPATILEDHTRPVDPSKGEAMMEAVREAGGTVSSLKDYLGKIWPTLQKGSRNSKESRMFFKDASGNFVSPFHDIPMLASEGVYNMVVEVPRWSNAKMEIDTKGPLNPIVQDQKNDKLRFVANVFPHHGYIFNYGAIPQTWEDPNHTDQWTNYKGDKDPIDVCEIGSKIQPTGAVIQVKVLGVFALIDDEETDWKLICIDVTDPLAEKLNDIEDVDTEMPGFLEMAVEWFKKYKIPNKPNPGIKFAFNDKPKNKEFAENIIAGTHEHWKKLMSGSSDSMGLSIINTSLDNTASVDQEQAKGVISELPEQGADLSLPDEIHKWHYVSLE